MATKYCDPAASGADNGTSWTDAWETFQKAADTAVAGDVVYCRGTDTLAAIVDIDINANVRFIGCNAGGTEDGTKFVLDGNSAVVNCVLGTTIQTIRFTNFEFKNATGDGVDGDSNCHEWAFVNCVFHNNGNCGLDITAWLRTSIIRCQFYSNTQDGIKNPYQGTNVVFCAFYSNTDSGIVGTSLGVSCSYVGNVFHDNGDNDYGIENISGGNLFMNNVFEGTDQTGERGLDFRAGADGNAIIGNRFANLTTGFDNASGKNAYGWNYFHNNTTDVAGTTNLVAIPNDADLDTNEFDVDADDGFNDVASDDFNLKASRTLRRTAIDLKIGS